MSEDVWGPIPDLQPATQRLVYAECPECGCDEVHPMVNDHEAECVACYVQFQPPDGNEL